jgi:hypothetical protein
MEERTGQVSKTRFRGWGPENQRDLYQNQFTGERQPWRSRRFPESPDAWCDRFKLSNRGRRPRR